MTCPEVQQAFSALYDGALPKPALSALQHHLANCSACEHEWQAFQSTVAAIRGLGAEDPSAGFAGRVMARIQAPQAPRWWERVARGLVFPLPVKLPLHAAALVLLSLGGVWLFQRSPELQAPQRHPLPPMVRPEAPRPDAAPPAVVPHPAKPRGSGEPKHEEPTAPRQVGPADSPGPADASKHEAATVPRERARTNSAESAGSSPPAAPGSPDRSSAPALDQAGPLQSDLRRREEHRAATREGLAAKSARKGAAEPADELWSEVRAALAAGKYDEAGEQLRTFLTAYPEDPRAGAARFWLAEAYRAKGAYAEASRQYEDFLRRHPADEKAPAATYGLGEAWLRSDKPKGCEALRGALRDYPDLPQAPAARHLVESRCP